MQALISLCKAPKDARRHRPGLSGGLARSALMRRVGKSADTPVRQHANSPTRQYANTHHRPSGRRCKALYGPVAWSNRPAASPGRGPAFSLF